MKISEKVKENKIFFVTFILLNLTCFIFISQRDFFNMMDNFYYPLYVINYDCGYSSRLLVGAVFSLFFKDTLNVDVLSVTLLIIYLIMCFCLSLFINNYIKKTKFEAIGIYAVFMILCPAFISLVNYFGILDIFWIFCTMGALWVVDKKGLRWLVPLFCIIGLAVHEVFLTTYLPVIAIAVLYQFAKKPDTSNLIYAILCAVIIGAFSVYFFFIGDSTMKMTSDELVEFARNRLDEKGKCFDDFYLRSVFFWEVPDVEEYHGLSGYLSYIFNVYTQGDSARIKTILYFVISDGLVSAPFVYVIIKALKKEQKLIRKFIFFCSLMPIPLILFQLLVSTDTERFAMHWLVIILFVLLFFVKEKDLTFGEAYSEAAVSVSKNKVSLALAALAVAKIVFSGVRF